MATKERLNAERYTAIETLQTNAANEARGLLEIYEEGKAENERQLGEAKEEVDKTLQAELENATAEIARLDEKVRTEQRLAGAKDTVAGLRATLTKKEDEASGLDLQVQWLEHERGRMLEKIPIEGVAVDESGELTVDGVPWQSVSLSRRMRVAIHIAKIRAGDIALICVDGVEAFDERNFEAFKSMVVESGLQAITARVAETPDRKLKVSTDKPKKPTTQPELPLKV